MGSPRPNRRLRFLLPVELTPDRRGFPAPDNPDRPAQRGPGGEAVHVPGLSLDSSLLGLLGDHLGEQLTRIFQQAPTFVFQNRQDILAVGQDKLEERGSSIELAGMPLIPAT